MTEHEKSKIRCFCGLDFTYFLSISILPLYTLSLCLESEQGKIQLWSCESNILLTVLIAIFYRHPAFQPAVTILSKKESNKKEGKMEHKYRINKYWINSLKYKYWINSEAPRAKSFTGSHCDAGDLNRGSRTPSRANRPPFSCGKLPERLVLPLDRVARSPCWKLFSVVPRRVRDRC